MNSVEIIAHRGIHSNTVRENSEQSISACVGVAIDGIEIDVRITSDDVCVVHHNTRLQSGARLSRLSFDELSVLDPHVLRIDKALQLLDPFNGLINLEVKHLLGERDRFRGLACVEQLSLDVEDAYSSEDKLARVLISSFSLPNVRGIAHHLPHVARAYLAPRALSFSRMLSRAARYECSAIHVAVAQMKSRRFSDFVRNAHDAGQLVRVYTVNSEQDLSFAHACGVDGIFTDAVAEMNQLRNSFPGAAPGN